MRDYLQNTREQTPAWLTALNKDEPFPYKDFFASRVVYYPGSGSDGHAVELFGSTHCTHCFVYSDDGITQAELIADLACPTRKFKGYHSLARFRMQEQDLVSIGGNLQHGSRRKVNTQPFGFFEILERDQHLDESHGVSRLAILFLGADGFASYDALFCQGVAVAAPFAVVVQDHGFGGNQSVFGRGGQLEAIARRYDKIPNYLLVAENSRPWQGFQKVQDLDGDPGGMHRTPRFLWKREPE